MKDLNKAIKDAMKKQYMSGINDALDSFIIACDSAVKTSQEEGVPDTLTFTNLKKMIQEIKEQANQQVKEIHDEPN